MSSRDDPKQGPNPAFLRTKMLGSRNVNDLDYEDEAPTGVDHKPSNRPRPLSARPARVDPSDVYMLTDPARQDLPSFADTVVGPGTMETPRSDLPPVAPVPAGVSPLAHSPTPPPPGAVWPAPAAAVLAAPEPQAIPTPHDPTPMQPKRRAGIWKPVQPPPRYLPRPPVAKPITPDPSVHEKQPAPVEDQLLNAILIFVLGLSVAVGATWAFLNVTHTRSSALSEFITSPMGSSQPK